MPELPEVETIRRGLLPLVKNRRIEEVVVREPRLRWRVPKEFPRYARGRTVENIERRGKYLVLQLDRGDRVLIHLGMTGRLFVLRDPPPLGKHDHVEIRLDNGLLLRYHDIRRFGAILPWPAKQASHPLVANQGAEPFSKQFSGDYLFKLARGRSVPVKNFIMDGKVVVGVGNIYASEALFRAALRPQKAAGKVSRVQYAKLADKIRETLDDAIAAGGTTLRDFANHLGEAGDFQQQLYVYGREGDPCLICGAKIRQAVIGQRSSYWCPRCQK